MKVFKENDIILKMKFSTLPSSFVELLPKSEDDEVNQMAEEFVEKMEKEAEEFVEEMEKEAEEFVEVEKKKRETPEDEFEERLLSLDEKEYIKTQRKKRYSKRNRGEKVVEKQEFFTLNVDDLEKDHSLYYYVQKKDKAGQEEDVEVKEREETVRVYHPELPKEVRNVIERQKRRDNISRIDVVKFFGKSRRHPHLIIPACRCCFLHGNVTHMATREGKVYKDLISVPERQLHFYSSPYHGLGWKFGDLAFVTLFYETVCDKCRMGCLSPDECVYKIDMKKKAFDQHYVMTYLDLLQFLTVKKCPLDCELDRFFKLFGPLAKV